MAQILDFRRKPNPPLGGWGFKRIAALAVVGLAALALIGKMKADGVFDSLGYAAFVTLAGLVVAIFVIRKFGR